MRGAKTGGRVTDERLLDAVERYIREHQRQNGKSPTLRQIMRAFPRGFPQSFQSAEVCRDIKT